MKKKKNAQGLATGGSNSRSALDLVREGDRLRAAGDFPGAEDAYRQATRVDPRCPEAWAELGCLLADCRRFSEAITCFRQVLGSDTKSETHDYTQETVQLLAQIAAAKPTWTRGQFSLGCVHEHLGEFEPARIYLAEALRIDPSREAAVQALFARMYFLEQKWNDGISAADRALAANPSYFLAHVIRGRCCSALGRMEEATESTRLAIESAPHQEFHSDLLFDMNYLPETTPEELYAEACRWNSRHAAPLAKQIHPHSNTPDPERRLKVGYVSPDLYGHPIAKFIIPVLEYHVRARFEVFVYSVGSKSDQITDYIRGNVENFVQFSGPYTELTERVRADGIDILVDLAGHTMGPAYLAFALKPAPVQVSWLGVLSTTGMHTMDYFLGDAHLPCPGTELLFAETVYRLPRSLCCYRPTENVPLTPAPALERGYVTFGCFNNARKINREVVRLWSAVLHLVPDSRLLLKWHGMDTEEKQVRFRAWFVEDGIAPERLLFAGASTTTKYLEDYGAIDIALDPFPYNGGSTTLDALWMGVPVVTLAGRLPVQRCGMSMLSAIGLPDLVAQTPEQYLKVAVYLAAMVSKMPNIRQDVRRGMLSSPIMDELGHVRDLENAYRDMWRTWCRGKTKPRGDRYDLSTLHNVTEPRA